MSSNITSPSGKNSSGSHVTSAVKPPSSKGKAKAEVPANNAEEDDDEEDEEEEDEEMDDNDEDDDEDEEELDEIDPTAIVGRRTRGVRVDYTTKEALAKAGLNGEEEEEDEDAEMKD